VVGAPSPRCCRPCIYGWGVLVGGHRWRGVQFILAMKASWHHGGDGIDELGGNGHGATYLVIAQ
jgi:hypothetical protein